MQNYHTCGVHRLHYIIHFTVRVLKLCLLSVYIYIYYGGVENEKAQIIPNLFF